MKIGTHACGFIFAAFYLPIAFAAAQSPVGNWVTVDDKTGKKRAVITISESGGVINGIVDKIYPQPGDTGICDNCPGAFKGKPIKGMRFMWGLKNTGDNEWSGGSILDPKSGKIYRAQITPQGNNKLLVRGYVGVSLLGRSQVWQRE